MDSVASEAPCASSTNVAEDIVMGGASSDGFASVFLAAIEVDKRTSQSCKPGRRWRNLRHHDFEAHM